MAARGLWTGTSSVLRRAVVGIRRAGAAAVRISELATEPAMNAHGVGARSKRGLLLWLMLLFFAPLLFSFLVYYGSNWRPTGHTNHGTLIEPARPLPQVALPSASPTFLTGKWSLLYI